MRLGSWVMLPRGLLSLHERAVTAKERVVVRGNNK